MTEEQRREFQWLLERARLERPDQRRLMSLRISPALILDLQHELEALREDAWKYRDLSR